MSALQAMRDVADLHMAAKAISEEGGSKVGARGFRYCERRHQLDRLPIMLCYDVCSYVIAFRCSRLPLGPFIPSVTFMLQLVGHTLISLTPPCMYPPFTRRLALRWSSGCSPAICQGRVSTPSTGRCR